MSFERPPIIEMLRSETRKFSDASHRAGKFGEVPDNGQHLFTLHSANDWIAIEQRSPPPQMLFGEFWYQGELCILFADTNAGKSILAVQIGNAIAQGLPAGPFATHARNAKVLYVDFELSAKQFQTRYYSELNGSFRFHNHFYRAQFNPGAGLPFNYKTLDDYISAGLTHYIKKTGATVLIIDNISCLRSGTEHSSGALPLMKHLNELKAQYNLSVLVLAHTPKRNPLRPLSANDLQGSKMLSNFADSVFAIGASSMGKKHRYLKQIKQRNGAQVYDRQNVCLCQITMPLNCLQFEFTGYGHERDHLQFHTATDRHELVRKATELSATGLSQRQISQELNLSLGTVNKLLRQTES